MVDVDFGGNLEVTLEALRNSGSIAFYASNGDRAPKLPARVVMQKNLAIYGMVLPNSPLEARQRAQSDIARGSPIPGRMLSVAGRFPLAQTAAAHAAVERGGKVGTMVVETAR